jgi:hypothetical protein
MMATKRGDRLSEVRRAGRSREALPLPIMTCVAVEVVRQFAALPRASATKLDGSACNVLVLESETYNRDREMPGGSVAPTANVSESVT